jgi:hypothetical protein
VKARDAAIQALAKFNQDIHWPPVEIFDDLEAIPVQAELLDDLGMPPTGADPITLVGPVERSDTGERVLVGMQWSDLSADAQPLFFFIQPLPGEKA